MNYSFSPDFREYLSVYQKIFDEMRRAMTGAQLGCSISQNFIRQMIPHHRAAIEMSENLLRFTDNNALRDIAQTIIAEQTNSIETMRRIAPICAEYCNPRRAVSVYQRSMNRIMRTMFAEMRDARASGRIDCDFLREMIPHHMGAVRMSALTLKYGICPELVPVLEAIITSQRRGIGQMRELERAMRC